MQRALVTLGLVLLVAACATSRGFDRGALSKSLAVAEPVTEAEIQRVLDLHPQLPRPFKLGVYFKPRAETPTGRYGEQGDAWSWQPGDKQKVLDVGQSLQRAGFVSETVFISAETSAGQDLKSIRLAAAHHGVDAVLVVSGIEDVDRYNNALGVTYVLIVTGLFMPGTVVDGLFVSHAGLWDVRNGYLYASAEADGLASQTRPMAFAREHAVVTLARERSIGELSGSIEQHIKNLDGSRLGSGRE